MKKSILIVLTLFVVSSFSVVSAQTLDEILKKHFEAVGQEKLANAKSYELKAEISQNGMILPMEMKIKKPNKFIIEMELQGQKMVQAYDGENGWMIAPWISPDPQDMGGDQLKQAFEQTDLEGELYNYKKKGHSLEFVSKVNLDGKPAYKLKLTTKDGNVKYYFIDGETYYGVKVKSKVTANGQTVDVEQRMTDYKDFDGVRMATKMETDSPMGTATITIKDIKFNVNLDDSIFKKPGSK